jgi:antitoxin (DNA-binding transcriptional repressor) of toxin-antitoxin stability system
MVNLNNAALPLPAFLEEEQLPFSSNLVLFPSVPIAATISLNRAALERKALKFADYTVLGNKTEAVRLACQIGSIYFHLESFEFAQRYFDYVIANEQFDHLAAFTALRWSGKISMILGHYQEAKSYFTHATRLGCFPGDLWTAYAFVSLAIYYFERSSSTKNPKTRIRLIAKALGCFNSVGFPESIPPISDKDAFRVFLVQLFSFIMMVTLLRDYYGPEYLTEVLHQTHKEVLWFLDRLFLNEGVEPTKFERRYEKDTQFSVYQQDIYLQLGNLFGFVGREDLEQEVLRKVLDSADCPFANKPLIDADAALRLAALRYYQHGRMDEIEALLACALDNADRITVGTKRDGRIRLEAYMLYGDLYSKDAPRKAVSCYERAIEYVKMVPGDKLALDALQEEIEDRIRSVEKTPDSAFVHSDAHKTLDLMAPATDIKGAPAKEAGAPDEKTISLDDAESRKLALVRDISLDDLEELLKDIENKNEWERIGRLEVITPLDLRDRMAELLDRVLQGEEFLVKRRRENLAQMRKPSNEKPNDTARSVSLARSRSGILDRVKNGEVIAVQRRGRVLAVLVPPPKRKPYYLTDDEANSLGLLNNLLNAPLSTKK